MCSVAGFPRRCDKQFRGAVTSSSAGRGYPAVSVTSKIRVDFVTAAVLVALLSSCGDADTSDASSTETNASGAASPTSPAVESGSNSPVPTESETPVSATPTGKRADLQVTVIGDSIPYGQHFCDGCATFVDLYSDALDATLKGTVEGENLSTADDLTGERLVERIKTDETFRGRVAVADILIVTIGHNDQPWNGPTSDCDAYSDYGEFVWEDYTAACVAAASKRHAGLLRSVLDEARGLRGSKPTIIIVTTDYNDVISENKEPKVVLSKSTEILRAHREATCTVANAVSAACVDVYAVFNGPDGSTPADNTLLAPDHTHPSAAGQQAIADALKQVDVRSVTRP